MEETIISPIPDQKIYKDRAVYVGTFLGGPLVAGYLAAENFKHLGQPDKVKVTWVIAIAATLVVLVAAFYVPGIERVPRIVVPLIYTGVAQYLVARYQGAAIKAHVANGGQMYSVWRAVWIGAIGALVLAVLVIGLVLLINGNILPSSDPTN